ncbi:hypothetical protein B0H14DRAFT_2693874 [Mycena olivaceomarginata]|nr:hypothetical protein B0H14DRAFT_2693874 [Mycena olivaceomarginata]
MLTYPRCERLRRPAIRSGPGAQSKCTSNHATRAIRVPLSVLEARLLDARLDQLLDGSPSAPAVAPGPSLVQDLDDSDWIDVLPSPPPPIAAPIQVFPAPARRLGSPTKAWDFSWDAPTRRDQWHLVVFPRPRRPTSPQGHSYCGQPGYRRLGWL